MPNVTRRKERYRLLIHQLAKFLDSVFQLLDMTRINIRFLHIGTDKILHVYISLVSNTDQQPSLRLCLRVDHDNRYDALLVPGVRIERDFQQRESSQHEGQETRLKWLDAIPKT